MLIEASNWEKELLCPKISQTNKHASICCDFHNTLKKKKYKEFLITKMKEMLKF